MIITIIYNIICININIICINQRQYPDSTETFPFYPKKTTYIILKKKNKPKEDKWKGINFAINYLGNFNHNSKFGMATKKLSMNELLEIQGNKKISIPIFKNSTLIEKMKTKFMNSSFKEILFPSKPNESRQCIYDNNTEEMGNVFSFNENSNTIINSNTNTNNNSHSHNYSNDKKLVSINSNNNLSFQEQIRTNDSECFFHKMNFGRHFNNISLNKFTKNNLLKSKCSIIKEAFPIFPVINTNKRKTSKINKREEIFLFHNLSNKEIKNKLTIKQKPIKSKQYLLSLLNKTYKQE